MGRAVVRTRRPSLWVLSLVIGVAGFAVAAVVALNASSPIH
jgi:hypothetical protein